MSREFHISAFDLESRFTVQGPEGAKEEEFETLFEAARYAREHMDHAEGMVIVHNGSETNSIPVHAESDEPPV